MSEMIEYKLSTFPIAFEHDMKYTLLIHTPRFKVISFSQERERILSYIKEFSGKEVSGNDALDHMIGIEMYSFPSDTEDSHILTNLIAAVVMESEEFENIDVMESEQSREKLLLDIDMLDYSKLIKFGIRFPYTTSNIECIGDADKYKITTYVARHFYNGNIKDLTLRKLSAIPDPFEENTKYVLIIRPYSRDMLVISFSQEREDMKVFISEQYHQKYYQELIIYSFHSDEEDIEILKYLILQMGIENQEPLEPTLINQRINSRELRTYLDLIVPDLRNLEKDIDALNFSKLVVFRNFGPRHSAFNIDSIEDRYRIPIQPKVNFQLNNIGVGYLFLDSESIINEMYAFPKTDEKVVILQSNCLCILDESHINKLQIHISNWKDFIDSPISSYVLYGAYSMIEVLIFSNDCPDEMIVEEIRKYFSIEPFEKMFGEEPSNPFHISIPNGYENPITLSR
jgi:hypothetical protein